MSVRSAARGNPAAKSIRFALRTSSIVATSSANFSRCVLRWLGSRRLRSALMLSAIRVMPSTIQVLGPLKAKSLNHTPTPAVNPDLPETDGWQVAHLYNFWYVWGFLPVMAISSLGKWVNAMYSNIFCLVYSYVIL